MNEHRSAAKPQKSPRLLLGLLTGRTAIALRSQTLRLTRQANAQPQPAPTPIKIAIISDCHVGPYVRPSYIDKAVEMLNSQNCDINVILGDIASSFSRNGTELAATALGKLQNKTATLACLGNHEIRSGKQRSIAAMEAAGIRVLVNSHIKLDISGRSFVFAGLDDILRGNADPTAMFHQAPAADHTIILCHNPDGADMLGDIDRPIDLMLSGHTHASQVRLFGKPVMWGTKNHAYDYGLATGPKCPVYISAGLGVTRWPIRYNCPPEVNVLTLQ